MPIIFNEGLHEDLGEYILFQYIDDLLLITTADQETCLPGTENLLQTLGNLGYQASAKKAQICKQQVMYLGYILRGGQR